MRVAGAVPGSGRRLIRAGHGLWRNHYRDPSVSVDGIVGPGTGNLVITDGDPYYTGGGANDTAYCFAYLPTTYN
ncbi:hypothetical protein ACFXOD_21680 [Streptomyces sp. NPDC059161]|uniref:hypothetical protein n=1 Tax=Streptomyces sp. NPDC059161 TaxID=3346749 RepID=UPI0036CE191B